MLRSVTNSSQSSSLPHLLSAIHDIPHNILLPPARPASQSRAVVLESSCIQCAAVAEKVSHYLSLFTLALLALMRALSPSALRSKYLKPHCRCGRCSPAAAQRERLFGNSYVLNPVGDFRIAELDFGTKDGILPPSHAARCDGRSSAVELRYQCN